jgi:hypothetical protein
LLPSKKRKKGDRTVNSDEILAIVKKRRDDFFDSQIAGTAEDPLEYTSADVKRAIADEYDSFLLEIQSGNPQP